MTEQQFPTIHDARLENLIDTAIGVNGTFGRARWAS